MFSPFPVFFRVGLCAGLLFGGVLASIQAQGTDYHTALPGTSVALAKSPAATLSFTQFVVFGDSLSDTGNFAATTEDDFAIRYPGTNFNYADGRFTDDTGTTPAAKKYTGVWHEQLARFFLGMTPAAASLDGGTDYAFGDAETLDGQRNVELQTGVSFNVDNMGQQVSNYLGGHVTDPKALYIVWGGANDLFADDSAANVTAAAQRETVLVQRLAEAGATAFLVPNLPPLGLTPEYSSDAMHAAALTQAAAAFRTQLNADLDALQTLLAQEGLTVTIYRLDIFDLFNRLTVSAGAAYGFTDIVDSVQGQSVKADQSLFWDGVHPTTYGHFQIAAEAYTLLTGTPVVEISQAAKHVDRATGETGVFLLTRTGTDLSQTLSVPYTVGGTAVAGTDYVALKGHKNIKAGKRTAEIKLVPAASTSGTASTKVKLTLAAGTGYALPVVKTGTIILDPAAP